MAETIRSDPETEHAPDVLTGDGASRSSTMRRAVLRSGMEAADGVDLAAEIARDRDDER
ncbi:hypothetical protein [Saccharopolyspora flava]|uniref:Uncharacterized protein n=1 Tax=Saccharopolyspora flava TaxID=95161 RepID=A0A1I6PP50_9PSEU|nr:hypothetical protein [Saccharopolyspora flava]SFS42003.1 hypothetical protein SAMN05660874_00979 [Saccharopolyspora flava]